MRQIRVAGYSERMNDGLAEGIHGRANTKNAAGTGSQMKQKLDQVMDIEAVHFLKKEQEERQGIVHDKSVGKDE